MFSRIRETIRILAYREPHCKPENDACFMFTQSVEPRVSVTGKRIASLLIGFATICVVAKVAGPISEAINHNRPLTVTTVAGGIGALLMAVIDWLRNDILQSIRAHTKIEEKLAPSFGHKLETVFRVLKGSARVS